MSREAAKDLAAAQKLWQQGERWRARDLLLLRLATEADETVSDRLGGYLMDMGDDPAAGAVWFDTSVDHPKRDQALAAWREHFFDDPELMYNSLPASAKTRPRSDAVEELRAQARKAETKASAPKFDAASVVVWIIVLLLFFCTLVGLYQVLHWIVPG